MKPAFKCLYYFENHAHCIIEIKRTDLDHDADIADIFRWLFLDKEKQEIQSLTFRSMDSSGEIQERFFEQGYLKFNDQTATYIEKFNSAQHQLLNHSGTALPLEITETMTDYLMDEGKK